MVKWSACSPSDVPSSNLAEAYSLSVQSGFEKNENKQKEAGVSPF